MRTPIRWIFRGAAIVAALLATLQPVLGSFAFFRRGDPVAYESMHLVAGAALYNLSILLAILAPMTKFRRRWLLTAMGLLQYVFLHVQLRLGLGSNTNPSVLAYHIPVGVLIVGIAYLTVALSFGLRGDPGQA